jgi:hypothetical protein
MLCRSQRSRNSGLGLCRASTRPQIVAGRTATALAFQLKSYPDVFRAKA